MDKNVKKRQDFSVPSQKTPVKNRLPQIPMRMYPEILNGVEMDDVWQSKNQMVSSNNFPMQLAHHLTPFLDKHVALRLLDHLISKTAYPIEEIEAAKQSLLLSPEAIQANLERQEQLCSELGLDLETLSSEEFSQDQSQKLLTNTNLTLELSRIYYEQEQYETALKLLTPLVARQNSYGDVLWGSYACALLSNSPQAVSLFNRTREHIEAERRPASKTATLRATLLHWSLPLFVQDPSILIDLMFRFAKDSKYLSALANVSPFLVRWVLLVLTLLDVSEIHGKAQNILRLVQNCVGDSQLRVGDDPVVQFFQSLFDCHFIRAQQLLSTIKSIVENDYFLESRAQQIYENLVTLVLQMTMKVCMSVELKNVVEWSKLSESDCQRLITEAIILTDCEFIFKDGVYVVEKEKLDFLEEVARNAGIFEC
ncbi:hypothetical protein RCL1_008262 [Eukaryota sp. TZLM3-RCL]